jgi:hypothetical protein
VDQQTARRQPLYEDWNTTTAHVQAINNSFSPRCRGVMCSFGGRDDLRHPLDEKEPEQWKNES